MSDFKNTMTPEEEARWEECMKSARPFGTSLRDLCDCDHMRMYHEYGHCSRCLCKKFERPS